MFLNSLAIENYYTNDVFNNISSNFKFFIKMKKGLVILLVKLIDAHLNNIYKLNAGTSPICVNGMCDDL